MGLKVLAKLLLLSITSKDKERHTATIRLRRSMQYLEMNADVELELGIN